MSIEFALIKYIITNGRTTIRIQFDCDLIPVEYLVYFSSSNNANIREKIAANKNTPHTIIEKLSYDGDRYVRLAIVRNSNTSSKILVRMRNDEHWLVSDAAKNRLAKTK